MKFRIQHFIKVVQKLVPNASEIEAKLQKSQVKFRKKHKSSQLGLEKS